MRSQSSWLAKQNAQEAEQKTLMVVTLKAAKFSFPYAEVCWTMNVPCVIGDPILNIQCISNMLECELLACRFSEFLWLSFLSRLAYLPWGYLGKKEIYE